MRRLISAASGAMWSGVIVAILGAIADLMVRSRGQGIGSIPFYFVVGWSVAFVWGAVMGSSTPPIGTAFLVAGLFSLYPLNAFWLAGQPWVSGGSIAADLLLMFACLLPACLLRRWSLRPGPSGYSVALLGGVALVWSATVLLASPAAPARDKPGKGPDILLIVLDCVRRDHVGFLGYSRSTSAAFEPYLSNARIYENAYSTASWTAPSTRDILGVVPGQKPGSGFPPRLASIGYATLMLSDNPHLSGPPSQYFGFEEKRRSVAEWKLRMAGSVAGEVLNRLQPGNDLGLADGLADWLVARKGPVYVHAHLMNAHAPFRFPPIDGKPREGRKIEFPVTGQVITETERDSIVARYDEGVRTAFVAVRRIIETMRARGRPLLVLLTADHGEFLGERGNWFHGVGLDQELLRVPLLTWGEGVNPGRVSGLASNAQLPETIMASARGDAAPSDLRTSSGIEQLEGGLPDESAFRVRGSYKVLVSNTAAPRLFSISDLGAVTDITASEPELAKSLAFGLKPPKKPPAGPFVDPATTEALRSLGYVR